MSSIAGIIIGKKGKYLKLKEIKKNNLNNIVLYFLPLSILTIINLISIFNFNLNSAFDVQPYLIIISNLKGKVLIHLLAAGTIYKLYSSKFSKFELFFLIFSVLNYTILFSERAYIIPFLAIILLETSKRNVLNRITILKIILISLSLFVGIEATRSFLFARLLEGDFNIWDALLYGLKRFFVYFSDTYYKGAYCLEKGSSSLVESCLRPNLYWISSALTNYGILNYLYPKISYITLCCFTFLFSVLTSKIIMNYERSEKNGWDQFFAPYFFTAILESPRWNYIFQIRFLMIFPIIIYLYLIINRSKDD